MKVNIIFTFIVFSLFSGFLPHFTTQSVIASDFHSPRTSALGGAGHAGPLLNDAIYLNPSFTAFLPTYSMSGSGMLYKSGNEMDKFKNTWGASVMDGQTALFQAGVGLSRRLPYTMIHLGAAKAAVDRLGFGLGAKYYFKDQNYRHGDQDMTFSVTGIVMKWFQTAMIVDNILQRPEGKKINLYREITLGTKFNIMEILLLYVDPHWTPSLERGRWIGYEFGAEITVMSDFYIRLGNFKNARQPYLLRYANGWGAGLGWLGPKLSIDYGLSRVNAPILAFAHNLGLTLYF